MITIKFIATQKFAAAEFAEISSSVVDLVLEKQPVDFEETEISGGFEIINEYNDSVEADFGDYATIYRKIDELHYQLSNDGSVYTEPEEPPVEQVTVTFEADRHLTLGFSSLKVDVGTKLEDIGYPSVESTDEEYKFLTWSQTEGEIASDITIYAYEEYEHISTFEEALSSKIASLASTCERMITQGVDVRIGATMEHFSYGVEDQSNIDDLVSMITSTGGMSQPYHADDKICKLYTAAQIVEIYVAQKLNKTHHITYFNSLKAYVQTLRTKEEVEAVTYGQELEGLYLTNYESMMAQAQAITEAVLKNLGGSSSATEAV